MKVWENAEISEINVSETAVTRNEWGVWDKTEDGHWFLLSQS